MPQRLNDTAALTAKPAPLASANPDVSGFECSGHRGGFGAEPDCGPLGLRMVGKEGLRSAAMHLAEGRLK